MNRRQYITFTKELVENGYQFRKDCPYQGSNKWVKQPDKDADAKIEIDVFRSTDETGENKYTLKPKAIIKQSDCESNVRITIYFDTIDLACVESVFNKYIRILK